MGKIRNIVKEDMVKIFTCSTFWLAVLAVAAIALTGTVTKDMGNNSYTIFDLVSKFTNEQIMYDMIDASAWGIIYKESGSYLWMFVPVLAGMPLVPLLCAERKNKAMRYELIRVGKTKFVIGKMISSMLSGGLVLMLGYALFSLVIYILMPIKGDVQGAYAYLDVMIEHHPGFDKIFTKMGFSIILIMKLLLFFVYGAFSALMAYVLSSFITNKYIVLCIPYIANYMICMFVDRQMMRPAFWDNPKWFTDFVQFFKLDCITKIYLFNWDYIKGFAIQQLIFLIVGVIIYQVVMRRRCDCGQ